MSKINIIIVDDEVEIVEMVESYLQISLECNIKTFTKSQNALDYILAQKDIDFIISDIRMPGIDGVALMEKTREVFPSKPKIILMSGFSEYSPEALASKGANYFINKPLGIESLIEFIEKNR